MVRASENWYVINNYEGTVGSNSIYMSFQYYDFGEGTNIKGSYYYDEYRSPIALYGKKKSNLIELCEVESVREYEDQIIGSKAYNSNYCPFKLTDHGDVLHGVWQNKKNRFKVLLTHTGSLTKDTFSEGVKKTVEVPFWGQTDFHSFIGIYEITQHGVSVNKIKVLNKKSGKVDQIINPQLHNCNFGFFMTSIYQNLEIENNHFKVLLNCYSTGSDVSVIYRFDNRSKSYSVDGKANVQ
jgi:hypothetical protein